jgi:hypothetical protein
VEAAPVGITEGESVAEAVVEAEEAAPLETTDEASVQEPISLVVSEL